MSEWDDRSLPQSGTCVSVSEAIATAHADKERCPHLDLLPTDGFPVDALEPAVSFDVSGSTAQVAESFRQVGSQESPDEISRDRVDVRRNAEFSRQNLFVDFERVVGIERRVAGE